MRDPEDLMKELLERQADSALEWSGHGDWDIEVEVAPDVAQVNAAVVTFQSWPEDDPRYGGRRVEYEVTWTRKADSR